MISKDSTASGTEAPGRVAPSDKSPFPPAGMKLHLGSGPRAVPGWLNVDKSRVAAVSRISPVIDVLGRLGVLSEQQRTTRWSRDVTRRDLTKPFPWPTGSARAIYSSHMLEHLDRAQAHDFLNECFRVLASGGVIRLVLPDLAGAVERYQQAKQLGDARAADELISFLYFVPPYENMARVRRLAMRLLHRPHAWMYDEASLTALLRQVGFAAVQARAFREGMCPDLERLEHRHDEAFEGSSFFVEGVRP